MNYSQKEFINYAKHHLLAVGDSCTINFLGRKAAIVVIGENHDTTIDGTKAGYTYQFVDCIATARFAAGESTYTDSEIRARLNGEFFDAMPAAFKKIIVPVKKDTRGTITTDQMFLLSEREVYGNRAFYDKVSGRQYAYYKRDWKAKYKREIGKKYATWWMFRSQPYSGSSTDVCGVNSYGSGINGGASGSYGVAPCFCSK